MSTANKTTKPGTMSRDVSMQIRCSEALRSSFVASCKGQDKNASQLVREFMRSYIAKHGQGDLF